MSHHPPPAEEPEQTQSLAGEARSNKGRVADCRTPPKEPLAAALHPAATLGSQKDGCL